MALMKAMQVTKPHGQFELVEREIPNPPEGYVRIQVHACGICHSDAFVKEGLMPVQYPRVPGHEVAGVIDALGPNVRGWKVGDRVGVGWYGGHCSECESCRKGDFINCQKLTITGLSSDGGYSEYMLAKKEALARIPDVLSFQEAAPLLCAGITTFNALRESGARGGDLVAVLGIGGLGHLALQFAAKMGFRTVAIARGQEKDVLANELGAISYIDSSTQHVASELLRMGGAKVILSTVTDSDAIGKAFGGLAVGGVCLVVGASQDPIPVTPLQLIRGRHTLRGWPSGTSIASEETMCFCALQNIRSKNQIFPLENAEEAYQFMMAGKARFRAVLQVAK